jgi:hypothetical protein
MAHNVPIQRKITEENDFEEEYTIFTSPPTQ